MVYDGQDVLINLGGVPIADGLAGGEFMKIVPAAPGFTSQVGRNGEVARSKTGNRLHTIELTLMQTSPVNVYLSGLHEIDQAASNGAGIVPLLVKSKLSLFAAGECWIEQAPDMTYGVEAGTRVWKLAAVKDVRIDADG